MEQKASHMDNTFKCNKYNAKGYGKLLLEKEDSTVLDISFDLSCSK